MKWIERLKWRVAYLLDRLPGQCWADWVSWVYRDGRGWREERYWRAYAPWWPMGATCREDFARTGACYCGKLRRPEVDGIDEELARGWDDVAARMARWEAAGYAGHWTDAEYDEVDR